MFDIQAQLDALMQREREKRQNDGGWTLADLTAAVEMIAADDPDHPITGASGAHSYRGYYSDLAFEPGNSAPAWEVLAVLKACDGHVFTGYKGGDFPMDGDSPVWSATYGNCGERIVGIDAKAWPAKVITRPDED